MWWIWVIFQDTERGGGKGGRTSIQNSCHEFHCYIIYKNVLLVWDIDKGKYTFVWIMGQ